VHSEKEIEELKEYISSLRDTLVERDQIIEKLNENNTILTQKLYEEIENNEYANNINKGNIFFIME